MSIVVCSGSTIASVDLDVEGPVRVPLDCRRTASGRQDDKGYGLHVGWQPRRPLQLSPTGCSAVVLIEFDADYEITLPDGRGTLSLLGGRGPYEAALYKCCGIAPESYTRHRRQLCRLMTESKSGLTLQIPTGQQQLGGSGVAATSDDVPGVSARSPSTACRARPLSSPRMPRCS